MPTLAELRNRFVNQRETSPSRSNVEEALVSDVRGRLTPAQVVELKLRGVLPVSSVRGVEPFTLTSAVPEGE